MCLPTDHTLVAHSVSIILINISSGHKSLERLLLLPPLTTSSSIGVDRSIRREEKRDWASIVQSIALTVDYKYYGGGVERKRERERVRRKDMVMEELAT